MTHKISLLFALVSILALPCDAIKMAVNARPRCIVEDFWEPVNLRVEFKWHNPGLTNVKIRGRDYTTNTPLFESTALEGTLNTVSKHVELCFLLTEEVPCVGWRQTSDCNPHGTREPENDLACDATVANGMSGYCECLLRGESAGDPLKKYFTCEHRNFLCKDICAESLPPAAIQIDLFAGEAQQIDVSNVATTDFVNAADMIAKSVHDLASQVHADVVEFKLQDDDHGTALERGNSLVVAVRMCTIVVAVICGVTQAILLKDFLHHKKII